MSNQIETITAKIDALMQRKNYIQQQQQQQLPFIHTKSNGTPLGTYENFEVLLKHYGITIRYNEMTKEEEIDIPGNTGHDDLSMNSKTMTLVSLAHRHGYPKSDTIDMITLAASQNAYHPVRDWIDAQVWDGTSRLQTYYDSIILKEPNPMKETMMRKWALSLVSALYHPNFSCEGVLTLSGSQGLGKTTWVEELLPKEYSKIWTKDGVVLDMRNKDTLLKALCSWIVELGELDATFKKSDIEALKGFITEKTDVIRPPYARTANKYTRRTVFYATVNETNFLQDDENRRFWVLSVAGFKTGLLDSAQFWAEMKQLYLSVKDKIGSAASRQEHNEWGWFMSPSERAKMKPLQEDFKVPDPIEQTLERYLKPSNQLSMSAEWMNATEILERCSRNNINRRDLIITTKWLAKHDYKRDRMKKWLVEITYRSDDADTQFDHRTSGAKLANLRR